jgi:hypothetical protein
VGSGQFLSGAAGAAPFLLVQAIGRSVFSGCRPVNECNGDLSSTGFFFWMAQVTGTVE